MHESDILLHGTEVSCRMIRDICVRAGDLVLYVDGTDYSHILRGNPGLVSGSFGSR